MKIGAVSRIVMKRSVLKQLHTTREEILRKASSEETCTILGIEPDIGRNEKEEKASFSATASLTGNSIYCGMYCVARAINDIAISGGIPIAVAVNLLLPPAKNEKFLRMLTEQIEAICRVAKVQITTLHAEVTSTVIEPVVFASVQGVGQQQIKNAANFALPGQDIVLCGHVGTEGMLRILDEQEKELSKRFTPMFVSQMKQARDTILAIKTIHAVRKSQVAVSAMYQIGSGGIFAGLWEVGEASGIGMELELNKITILQETIELCEYYGLNPYQMTSAGCILMTTNDGDALIKAMEEVGVRASKLGIATGEKARVITSGEERRYLDRPAPDEWMRWKEETITV